MINYIHGIVVVNRPDLLAAAIESVKPLWKRAFILDNSAGGWVSTSRPWPIPIIKPVVPLSCAQSMNCLYRIARERGADVFGYQHNDAIATEHSTLAYLDCLTSVYRSSRRWAALWTTYDILSAYNVRAAADIGEWDWRFPEPNYHIDVDWFRRAELRGWEIIKTGLPVQHISGATNKSSKLRQMVSSITFPMNDIYYEHKWGGRIGEEVYTSPWNGVFGDPMQDDDPTVPSGSEME